jgi:hypothetical protein
MWSVVDRNVVMRGVTVFCSVAVVLLSVDFRSSELVFLYTVL